MRARSWSFAVVLLLVVAAVRAQPCNNEVEVRDAHHTRPIQRKRTALPAETAALQVSITAARPDTTAPIASDLVFPENAKLRLADAATIITQCNEPSAAKRKGLPWGECRSDCSGNWVRVSCSERSKDATWTITSCYSPFKNVSGHGRACVEFQPSGSASPVHYSVDCSGPPEGFRRTGDTIPTPVLVKVFDDNSGVARVDLEVSSPSGAILRTACPHVDVSKPELGYMCRFFADQSTESGTYSFRRLEVMDRAQNMRLYTTAPIDSVLHPIEVVIDSRDSTAPEAFSASVSAPSVINIKHDPAAEEPWSHDEVVFRFNVTDDISGFDHATFYFSSPAVFGDSFSYSTLLYGVKAGSPLRGLVEYRATSLFQYPGVWTLVQVSVHDTAGNTRDYRNLGALGFSRTSFQVRASAAEPEHPVARDIKPASVILWPTTFDLTKETPRAQSLHMSVNLTGFFPDTSPTVTCNLRSSVDPASFVTIQASLPYDIKQTGPDTMLQGETVLYPFFYSAGESFSLVGCYTEIRKDVPGFRYRESWHIYGDLTPEQEAALRPTPLPSPSGASPAVRGGTVSAGLLLAVVAATIAQLLLV